MATHIRYLNGVFIVEPHGKLAGNSISELQTAILPEVKAFDDFNALPVDGNCDFGGEAFSTTHPNIAT